MSSPRFHLAIRAIDGANARDPNRVAFAGTEYPAELIYSMRMSEWLARLGGEAAQKATAIPDVDASASEALRLAVRAQHLCRWEIPRSAFPMDRAGYHRWRARLAGFHAERAAEILQEVGCDAALIARVQSLIRKERLKDDPEAQTLEDVACLVFLEMDYVAFAQRHEPGKLMDILRKTWRKMSPRGHAAALELAKSLPEAERELLERAINPPAAIAPASVRNT